MLRPRRIQCLRVYYPLKAATCRNAWTALIQIALKLHDDIPNHNDGIEKPESMLKC